MEAGVAAYAPYVYARSPDDAIAPPCAVNANAVPASLARCSRTLASPTNGAWPSRCSRPSGANHAAYRDASTARDSIAPIAARPLAALPVASASRGERTSADDATADGVEMPASSATRHGAPASRLHTEK